MVFGIGVLLLEPVKNAKHNIKYNEKRCCHGLVINTKRKLCDENGYNLYVVMGKKKKQRECEGKIFYFIFISPISSELRRTTESGLPFLLIHL